MTDLTQLQDHARRLSTSDHRDDCLLIHRIVKVDRWLDTHGLDRTLSCPSTDGHEPHEWNGVGMDFECPGLCGGCMTDRERALWLQIAVELGAYFADDDGPGDDIEEQRDRDHSYALEDQRGEA